ncbi:dTDP-4-dehydrorhamnose 3,5-epimerase [Acidicapsa ligni]|uniref:dTDP-4-dehydrorhamnose 3,5-epimerase n=1 Tax=Acidicapsa ligni TaxID=542300 RepID=UPI0021DF5A24|nr:dTDP-4-dehydrorhamnose 3,5-epimerase [Acidicapsa ligni]
MNVTETSLPGVLVLEPRQFRDDRGVFFETFNLAKMIELGLPAEWKQDNFSISKANVVRGIHYQIGEPQGKLVRVITGAALDVIVDLRRSSPTFGQHTTVELSGDNSRMVWIPVGFGHGFAALTETVALSYKVTEYYSPKAERTILWNDPELAIDWKIAPDKAILSAKDAVGALFADAEVFA